MSFISWNTSNLKVLDVTNEEALAIRALGRIAATWPRKLGLFSWNGNLHVIKLDSQSQFPIDNMNDNTVATISNIPNEGGDPD